MSASECARFEQKLAFFAAPSLLGIKCASLLSLRKAEFQLSKHIEIFNTRAQVKGLRLKVLCECKNRYLVLIYQEAALRRQLAKPTVQAILRRYGYAADFRMFPSFTMPSFTIRSSKKFILSFPFRCTKDFLFSDTYVFIVLYHAFRHSTSIFCKIKQRKTAPLLSKILTKMKR